MTNLSLIEIRRGKEEKKVVNKITFNNSYTFNFITALIVKRVL